MNGATGQSGIPAGGAPAFFLLRIVVALLVSMLAPALAAAAADSKAPQGNPHLASVQIEI